MSVTNLSIESVRVIHGANDGTFDLVGVRVGTVRSFLVDAFNIPKHAIALVNGDHVDMTCTLEANDTLEFCKQRGIKGITRMLTQAQIRSEYVGVPQDILDDLFATFPHDDLNGESEPIWLELSVDGWIEERYSRKRADDGRDRVIPPSSVRIDGNECAGLTPKEWRLMEALLTKPTADQPGVLVEDVVDHVYGHDARLTKNPITQVIKRLNKKGGDEGWPFTVHEENGWVILMK